MIDVEVIGVTSNGSRGEEVLWWITVLFLENWAYGLWESVRSEQQWISDLWNYRSLELLISGNIDLWQYRSVALSIALFELCRAVSWYLLSLNKIEMRMFKEIVGRLTDSKLCEQVCRCGTAMYHTWVQSRGLRLSIILGESVEGGNNSGRALPTRRVVSVSVRPEEEIVTRPGRACLVKRTAIIQICKSRVKTVLYHRRYHMVVLSQEGLWKLFTRLQAFHVSKKSRESGQA